MLCYGAIPPPQRKGTRPVLCLSRQGESCSGENEGLGMPEGVSLFMEWGSGHIGGSPGLGRCSNLHMEDPSASCWQGAAGCGGKEGKGHRAASGVWGR